ncbi:MAG: LPXTG cell wall anchor domain-containing protein [Clostridium sp.]|uniref:LPXTG cell wall anchor domain-containing protein n=1 Tax=Clostridium sp. TaxID=1506 RepID=UPI00290B8EC0|nr:LPXTG cell wall anchor domain-containing protein [Clostridium sp.]MDU5110341.1 LPXTG cell wall anchor domain-containing protein [Clostridium sp.]
MKKIKLHLARILTFMMLIGLVSGGFWGKEVKAAEGGYEFHTIENSRMLNYLPYGNKMILAYENADDESPKKVTISSVENGKETILYEIEGGYAVNLSEAIADNVILLAFLPDGGEATAYKKFNLNENKIYDITEKEYISLEGHVEEEEKVWSDSEKEEVLQKINKKAGTNLTIKDKKLEAVDEYYSEYVNGNERIGIELDYRNSEKSVVEFYVSYTKNDLREHYSGLIFGDYVFVRTNKTFLFPTYIVDNGNLYIFTETDEEFSTKCEIIKITKDGVETHKSIDEVTNNSYMEVNGEYLYISHYVREGYIPRLNIYKANGNRYELVKSIDNIGEVSSLDGNSKILLSVNGEKLELIKLTGANTEVLYDLSDVVTGLSGIENNYVLYTYNGEAPSIIVMQKSTPNQPSEPEVPENPEVPETPENPGDNGNNNNVVIKPSEDKVIAEVYKINPNEKNEIKVNTNSSAKKVDVVIKDIESLKNGKGSLNITMNNGVQLNLPLSAIDKSLLDGAKDVTISLEIVEDSAILKDINAVNKVFDFNLIVNKEDGSTFIHNFKDGQVEITISLTDKDLEGLNKDNLVVYYYNDATKKFEAMETKVEGNEVTFKTPHFSKYVVAEKLVDKDENVTKPEENTNSSDTNPSDTNSKTEAGKGNLPNTGAVVSTSAILVIALAAVVVGGALFIRKKKHA